MREAAALTAYASGRYEEALREVSAVRRMRGDDSLRAVEADAERGLGHPEKAVEKAVRGMLPKTKLGRAQIAKLKVYRGAEHPHAAQQPKPFEITQVAQ